MKGSDLSILLVVAAIAGVLFLCGVSAIEPNGANVTLVRTERAPNDSAGSNNAMAGNITELNVFAYSTTSSWQGYIGNVSGSVRLADASGAVLYNWSLANPSGEVYASTNVTIQWSNIQCFNFTANGNLSTGGETAGGTSLYGTNLTILESRFGINVTSVDGINETFSDANSHIQFFTANQQFSAGECASTDVYDNAGKGTDGNFEEVLLYEPVTTSVVFATVLENDLSGYNSKAHDFEMLVLEDGHGAQATSTTPYYFFVELE